MAILLLLLMPLTLFAQSRPDAKALVTRADAAIFAAKTVRLAAAADDSFIAIPPTFLRSFVIQFEQGGRGREEFFAGVAGGRRISLTVFDGTNRWTYYDENNLYTKSPAKTWVDFEHEIDTLAFGRNPANILTASFENDESINFSGRTVPCYVVHVQYRSWPPSIGLGFLLSTPLTEPDVSRRVWISKDDEMIIRDYWENGTTKDARRRQYTTIETDVELPGSLFAFQPPPGSTVGTPRPVILAPPPPPQRIQ